MKPDPQIIKKMEAGKWNYAFGDDHALAELRSRIAERGRTKGLIEYSELVAGIEFRLPNLSDQPRTIDVHDWNDLDRAILGEFLGRICMESYRQHGFMASALAINHVEKRPSKHFFDWMKEIGALRAKSDSAQVEFWLEHVRLAHEHYANMNNVGT